MKSNGVPVITVAVGNHPSGFTPRSATVTVVLATRPPLPVIRPWGFKTLGAARLFSDGDCLKLSVPMLPPLVPEASSTFIDEVPRTFEVAEVPPLVSIAFTRVVDIVDRRLTRTSALDDEDELPAPKVVSAGDTRLPSVDRADAKYLSPPAFDEGKFIRGCPLETELNNDERVPAETPPDGKFVRAVGTRPDVRLADPPIGDGLTLPPLT